MKESSSYQVSGLAVNLSRCIVVKSMEKETTQVHR